MCSRGNCWSVNHTRRFVSAAITCYDVTAVRLKSCQKRERCQLPYGTGYFSTGYFKVFHIRRGICARLNREINYLLYIRTLYFGPSNVTRVINNMIKLVYKLSFIAICITKSFVSLFVTINREAQLTVKFLK